MINLLKLSKKIKPWGFSNLSIYDVALFFWKGIIAGSITTRASSLAFNFFLAFFPSVIVFFTLIPYLPISGLQETLMDILSIILPKSTNEATFNTLEDIINNPRGGLLSVGFILALYFSTNGINSLIEAFNASYHINESRNLFQQRLLSLFLTLVLTIMLVLAISLIVFGKLFMSYLVEIRLINSNNINILLYGKWIVIILMLFSTITTLFHFGPSLKTKLKIITPGSILSTIFIIITSIGFNYYIQHFAEYNKVYGSIGTLMILLLWIYFNSIILLTGFELNASISNAKKKNEIIEYEL